MSFRCDCISNDHFIRNLLLRMAVNFDSMPALDEIMRKKLGLVDHSACHKEFCILYKHVAP